MAATKPATFLTFAYGSNMLTNRIRERCPSARPRGLAELRGYSLRWHKRSRDGSGKCDVIVTESQSNIVFGVLFEIDQAQKPDLDRAEGLRNGYEEKVAEVIADGTSHTATLYYATNVDASLTPYTWYKALVVAGAREHGLPEPYIAHLASTEATQDGYLERHRKNMALAAGSGEVARL